MTARDLKELEEQLQNSGYTLSPIPEYTWFKHFNQYTIEYYVYHWFDEQKIKAKGEPYTVVLNIYVFENLCKNIAVTKVIDHLCDIKQIESVAKNFRKWISKNIPKI